MSASEAAADSSSHARQEADAEPQQHRWVALVSTTVILADGDERARAMPLGTDVELDLHDPPQPSYLVLNPRIVALNPGYVTRQPSAYILAADRSGHLLFRVTNDPGEDGVMYLCNTHASPATTLPLPAVPYARLPVEARPSRSVGLIADPDPRRRGHYLVTQLYPRRRGDYLLCFSTESSQWFVKPLVTSAPARIRCGETGVLAHAGRLYWLALAYGIFVCDPFATTCHLRFIPLPADCEMREEEEELFHRVYVAQRRRVAPSEGLLRYVEVRGLSYEVSVPPDVAPPPVDPSLWMWTLVDPEPEAVEPWRLEYEAPFAEVWAHESYVAAGLPHGEVPHVALVDPDDHGVVYFLQGTKLFGLDVRARRVVSCEECSVRDDREIMLRNSRPILDAWELSPPSPPRTGPASTPSSADDGEGQHREWAALSSVAVVLGVGDRDERAVLIAPGASDFQLDMECPPCPSYLILPERIAPDPRGFPSVVAVAADKLIVRATQGEGLQRAAYFLADVTARTIARLPEGPSLFRAAASRSVGLIPNPLRVDHFMVAQLPAVAAGRHESIITYCTATRRWQVKMLDSAPEHGHWRADGVVAHNDQLWWSDLPRGLLFCDPFMNNPELRFVPLPDAALEDGMRGSDLLHERRMLRPSEGKLRFVEVVGFASKDFAKEPPAVRIWTLVHPEGPNHWTLDRTTSFADIWGQASYAAAGLPYGVVPPLAFIDPRDAGTLCFFFGQSVAGIDVRTGGVVAACDDFWVDRSHRFTSFQKSSLVHSWVLELLEIDLSPSDKEGLQHLIRFIGRKPLSDKPQAGNVVSATAKAKSVPAAARPQATIELALGKLRAKLNAERRPEKTEKLIRELKHLMKELADAKKEAEEKETDSE